MLFADYIKKDHVESVVLGVRKEKYRICIIADVCTIYLAGRL